MKYKTVRNKYIISNYIASFFKIYFIYFIVFTTFALIGIFTGIFSVAKYNSGLTQKDFFDKALYYLSCGSLTFWKLFFNRVFYLLLIVFFSFLTSQNKFLLFLNCIGIVVLCYFLGMDIGIIINLFSVRTIMFTIIIYCTLMITMVLILLLLNCVMVKKMQEFSKYGMICNKRNCFIVLGIFLFLIILLQCIIFPMFNNVFIIIE